jgi:hydrogenase expression/formation protein HypC
VGEFDGVRRKIRLDFVPDARPGDFVIVHAGFAIEILDRTQALADREAYREVTNAL